jgi:hypothetical protein
MGDSLKQKSEFLMLTVFSGFSICVQIAPPLPAMCFETPQKKENGERKGVGEEV